MLSSRDFAAHAQALLDPSASARPDMALPVTECMSCSSRWHCWFVVAGNTKALFLTLLALA